MCRGGRTDLLLLQMTVRSSESEVMSWLWPISPVWTSCSLQQFDRTLQNVLLESCNRLSNSLTVPCLRISQKKNVTFLASCKCSFARCLKGKWAIVHHHIFCAKDIIFFYFIWNDYGEKIESASCVIYSSKCVVYGCHDRFHFHVWVQVRSLSH